MTAAPALANGEFTERYFTAEDGAVYKVRQPVDAKVSEDEILRAVTTAHEDKLKEQQQAAQAPAAANTNAAPTAVQAAKAEPAKTEPAKTAAAQAEPVVTKAVSTKSAQAAEPVSQQDLACLTEALYYEARGEGARGQQAVAEVILNRVDHPRFPKSVCGVVNQSGQFSYHGRVTKRFSEQGAYQRAKSIARAALGGAPRNLTGGATYFHAGRVRPNWSSRFVKTASIGSHVFYRSGGGQRLASN